MIFFSVDGDRQVSALNLSRSSLLPLPPPFFSGFLQLQLKEAVIIHLIEV